MDEWTITAIFFGLLFVVLGCWQYAIQRAARARTVRELEDARTRGTDRPVAQHPLVNPELCIGCSSCVRACPEEGVLGLVDGVARVIHGSRCIGHGRCAEACPVQALRVGLGALSERPDIPVLSEELETSVPGVFIAGELGGFALIRNAVEQGVRAIEAVGRRLASQSRAADDVLDVLIVGAGPAGIAASLKAAEMKLRYVTISQDELGGTVTHYPRRKLTMTQPVTLPLHGRMTRTEYRKEELIELWEQIRRQHRLQIRTGVRFVSATRVGDVFEAATSVGVARTRTILLALGRRGTPRRLGVPGEDTEKVFYRLIDASTYRDEHLLVVGGGDSAIEAATALASQPGNVVTLSYRKQDFFRLKPRNEERIRRFADERRLRVLFSSRVEEIRNDEIVLAFDGDAQADAGAGHQPPGRIDIPNHQVFVFAGGEPPFTLLRQLGVRFGGETPEASRHATPFETSR